MNNEILKIIVMNCIERCESDIEYYKNDERERDGCLDNINYLEGAMHGYKEVLRLMERENIYDYQKSLLQKEF